MLTFVRKSFVGDALIGVALLFSFFVCLRICDIDDAFLIAVYVGIGMVIAYLFFFVRTVNSTAEFEICRILKNEQYPHLTFYRNTEDRYKAYSLRTDKKEYIMLVAIKLTNGIIYGVTIPGEHFHVVQMAFMDDFTPFDIVEHGFITTHGRFVSRKEALEIALRVGQIKEAQEPRTELFAHQLAETKLGGVRNGRTSEHNGAFPPTANPDSSSESGQG